MFLLGGGSRSALGPPGPPGPPGSPGAPGSSGGGSPDVVQQISDYLRSMFKRKLSTFMHPSDSIKTAQYTLKGQFTQKGIFYRLLTLMSFQTRVSLFVL